MSKAEIIPILTAALPDPVRARLADLPNFDLADARARAIRAQLVRPRWGRPALAAAAVLLVAVSAPLLWQRLESPGAPAVSSRTATLESDLEPLRGAGFVSTPAAMGIEAELRGVDRLLQSAYDRGASEEEIAALWLRRDALLDNLLLAYRQREQLVRI